MIDFLHYLIKVSVIFSILYVVYFICFSRLTFHKLNRVYLVIILPLSLILPVLKIEFGSGILIAKDLSLLFNDLGTEGNNMIQAGSVNQFKLNIETLLFIAYSFILLIFLTRLLLNALVLLKIKRCSISRTDGDFTIIYANRSSTFSYFNWIFLPQNIESEISEQVINHEKLHGKLYHTLDLIIVELFVAFFWFNPFVYLFRRNLKSVHEFQIDNLLIKDNLKTSDYLQLLLNNLNSSNINATFCSSFNGSSIERRIQMMTKDKSSVWKTGRYLLLVPLVALMMAFSNHSNSDNNIPDISPIKAGSSFRISSLYSFRIHPVTKERKFHYGIDFSAKLGTPVVATANGVVTRVAFLEKGYGRLVDINHGNSYATRYSQLNDYAVKEGDKVKKGEVIGYVGQTGLSIGSHLHYEVLKNGETVNPQDYFTKE